ARLGHCLAGGAHSLLLSAVCARFEMGAASRRMERGTFPALARTGPLPAGAWPGWAGPQFLRPGPTTQSPVPRGRRRAGYPVRNRPLVAIPRLLPAAFEAMNNGTLDRYLSAASDYDASDLHLVTGVPPAFRVNGEIIIADGDALTEEEVNGIAD